MLLDAQVTGGFINTLKQWDTQLFFKINGAWHNTFLNSVFPWYRDAMTWTPLYLFLIFFVVINFGWKSLPWIVTLVLTVVITDQGSNIIKDLVGRPRPCHDDVIGPYVNLLLNRCPDSKSFTSNHASNHFGAACLLYFTLKPYLKNWAYLFFVWAATICYAQVYVGVHYPLDVISGAIFGSLIGCTTAFFFNRFIGLQQKELAPAQGQG